MSQIPAHGPEWNVQRHLPKNEHLCYTYSVASSFGDNETQARHDGGRLRRMCRNIKPLFNFSPPAGEDDVRAAALQYVRKVSGYDKPSRVNEVAFSKAVDEIAVVTARLLDALETSSPPKSREVEAARAKARSLQRFGGQ